MASQIMTDDPKRFPSDKADRFQVRMPHGLRDKIAVAAKHSNRSMNAEIVDRLEYEFNKRDWHQRILDKVLTKEDTDMVVELSSERTTPRDQAINSFFSSIEILRQDIEEKRSLILNMKNQATIRDRIIALLLDSVRELPENKPFKELGDAIEKLTKTAASDEAEYRKKIDDLERQLWSLNGAPKSQ